MRRVDQNERVSPRTCKGETSSTRAMSGYLNTCQSWILLIVFGRCGSVNGIFLGLFYSICARSERILTIEYPNHIYIYIYQTLSDIIPTVHLKDSSFAWSASWGNGRPFQGLFQAGCHFIHSYETYWNPTFLSSRTCCPMGEALSF